jgi:hypothetical protein
VDDNQERGIACSGVERVRRIRNGGSKPVLSTEHCLFPHRRRRASGAWLQSTPSVSAAISVNAHGQAFITARPVVLEDALGLRASGEEHRTKRQLGGRLHLHNVVYHDPCGFSSIFRKRNGGLQQGQGSLTVDRRQDDQPGVQLRPPDQAPKISRILRDNDAVFSMHHASTL